MRTILICMLCAVTAYAQYDSPARFQIPGAVPVGAFRPTDFRQGRFQQPVITPRIRRPGLSRPSFKSVEPSPRPNLQSLEDISAKPVTEEAEDDLVELNTPTTAFSPNYFSTTEQTFDFYDITTTSQPKPPSAYNSPSPQPFLLSTPQPLRPENIPSRPTQYRPAAQFAPVRNEIPQQSPPVKPIPTRLQPLSIRPQRPNYRPEPKPFVEEESTPIQPQPVRHYSRPQDPIRPPLAKSQPAQKYTASNSREKKPVAQILRKYRDENPDGSITWGFENDDGSFKEETIGIDCVTRGKYGYVDPDGLKREYNYETGILCDRSKEEKEEKGYVDYQENRAVLPNGVSIDLAAMGKKSKRPLRSPHSHKS